jgi:hypothetical protein
VGDVGIFYVDVDVWLWGGYSMRKIDMYFADTYSFFADVYQ